MKSCLVFLVVLSLVAGVADGGGDTNRKLDLSELRCDTELLTLVEMYIPTEVANELLAADLAPEALNFQIQAVYLPTTESDSSKTFAVVFYSGGLRHHVLQLFGLIDASWQLIAETTDVIGEGSVGIGAEDVDCDGNNEIILTSAMGAAGYRSMEVVKIVGDDLQILTPQTRGQYLVGRQVDFVTSDDGCVVEIQVWLDCPVKYQADRKRIYRLDSVSRMYKLAEEVKLETTDKE